MSQRLIKLPEKYVRQTRGTVRVNSSHPIYNKVVDLYVIDEHAGLRGDKVLVVTKNKVRFEDDIINIYDYRTKTFRTRNVAASYEYVEGYLERESKEVRKGSRIWCTVNA